MIKISNNDTKSLLLEFFDIYNKKIEGILWKYFESTEIQEIINQQKPEIKIYLKESAIKAHNLLLSIMLLSAGTKTGYILPDEAKIIFRSFFEHFCNLAYIFNNKNEEDFINLINRFHEFTYLAQYNYEINFLKDWEKGIIIKTPKTEKIYNRVVEIYQKANLETEIKEYEAKYGRYKSCWHGLSMQEFFEKAVSGTKFYDEFQLFKKYYTDNNLYTHCNLMNYINKEGIFVGNQRKEESLEVVYKSNFIYLTYLELFYHILGIKIAIKYSEIYNEFDILCDKYHKIINM